MAFETRIRDEYANYDGEVETNDIDDAELIELPIDEVPEGCDQGKAKLEQLKEMLGDMEDIDRFTDFFSWKK